MKEFLFLLVFFLFNNLAILRENFCEENGDQIVHLTNKLFLTFNSPNKSILEGKLGLTQHDKKTSIIECKDITTSNEQISCIDDESDTVVTVKMVEASISCYEVTWSNSYDLWDCYELGERFWYGGGEVKVQHWPLTNENRAGAAYITGDFFHYDYGGIVESMWMSSDGFLIYADPSLDLKISFNESNDNSLCISSLHIRPPPQPLRYVLCAGKNIRVSSERHLFGTVWRKPVGVPDEVMMTEPVWSTWAYYKAEINQTTVVKYAEDVSKWGFGGSHIEVDDRWEDCYGNLEFDSVKFPDPLSMVQQVKKLGFRITFWVHPFANEDCSSFTEGESKRYWVENNSSGTTQLVHWWNGVGGYLDTTNPDAANWYISRLTDLRDRYAINGFKFDAGEASWMPLDSALFNKTAYVNQFSKQYVDIASRLGKMVEVRTARGNQDHSLFIRMLDKNSIWGYQNGLKTLIPTTLLFSIFGYPFVLPDMIGGNAGTLGNEFPDKELYVRWLQANTFLPVMQFSIPPWVYDQQVVDITHKMVTLHRTYGPIFVRLAEEAVKTGIPIIRPLWWIAPYDKIALTIDSEFMVGDEILVAPVLDPGVISRDVYLPKGKWKDELHRRNLSGGIWLRGYNASLEELPYFVRLE